MLRNNWTTPFIFSVWLFSAIILVAAAGISSVQLLGEKISPDPYKIHSLVNEYREERGLAPLVLNETLCEVARMKADDMLEKQYFAHFNEDGQGTFYFMELAGYEPLHGGENLARGFLTSWNTFLGWRNSPGHNANMLGELYTEECVVVVKDSISQKSYVVQILGTPREEENE